MKPESESSERGIALATAIALALAVSLTAAIVLNLTFRRFELSAFRSDHGLAKAAAETGLQYAFSRLDLNDTNLLTGDGRPNVSFRQRVKDVVPNPLVISSDSDENPHHLEPKLRMSGRHVTVSIHYDPAGSPSGRPYRISAKAKYGEGQ